MSELLPCPFCGGNAEPEVYAWNDARVECMVCGYACTMAKDEPTAIAAWNCRAPVQASEARGDVDDDRSDLIVSFLDTWARDCVHSADDTDTPGTFIPECSSGDMYDILTEAAAMLRLLSAHTQAGPVGDGDA